MQEVDERRKIWMGCVNENKEGVNADMTADRGEWKRKTWCAHPT